MKFFLDTANLNEIREGAALGLADGVTTNPSLISKEGDVDFKQHIAAICEIVQGPVSAEVTSLDKDGMVREGREYAKIAPNVVIKCPLTRDGTSCSSVTTQREENRCSSWTASSRVGPGSSSRRPASLSEVRRRRDGWTSGTS